MCPNLRVASSSKDSRPKKLVRLCSYIASVSPPRLHFREWTWGLHLRETSPERDFTWERLHLRKTSPEKDFTWERLHLRKTSCHERDCTRKTSPERLHLRDFTWKTSPERLHLKDFTLKDFTWDRLQKDLRDFTRDIWETSFFSCFHLHFRHVHQCIGQHTNVAQRQMKKDRWKLWKKKPSNRQRCEGIINVFRHW